MGRRCNVLVQAGSAKPAALTLLVAFFHCSPLTLLLLSHSTTQTEAAKEGKLKGPAPFTLNRLLQIHSHLHVSLNTIRDLPIALSCPMQPHTTGVHPPPHTSAPTALSPSFAVSQPMQPHPHSFLSHATSPFSVPCRWLQITLSWPRPPAPHGEWEWARTR